VDENIVATKKIFLCW